MPLTLAKFRQAYPEYDKIDDDTLASSLHQKYYGSMPFDQFSQQIGYSPSLSARTEGYVDPAKIGHTLAGEAELLGTGVANIPHAVLAAGGDIYRRLTGGDTNPLEHTLEVQPGQAATDLVRGVSETPAAQAVSGGLKQADTALENFSPTLHDVAHQTAGVAGDIGALVPTLGAATDIVRGVGGAVARSTAEAATDAAKAGFRNTRTISGKLGETLADESAKPTLINHNAQVGNTIASSEAGVPHGTRLSYENLEAARAAPDSVYNRVGNQLPIGPLDEQARVAIQGAGLPEGGRITAGSPQAQTQIETLRARLSDQNGAFTGQQQVNELRALRQEGFTNIASEDVSNQQLGRAQLDMARAIEGHIARNLPANSDVSVAQFQDARKALAKNFTVQSTLRGSNVDLKALARVQRAEPQLLDGGLKTAADFANDNQEIVGLPKELGQPGVVKDIKDVNLERPIGSSVQAVGGSAGRRLLTGNTDSVLARTRRMFPDRTPERFGPLPPGPLDLQQPPGTAFEPHQPSVLGGVGPNPPLNPHLALQPPLGNAFEPHQPSMLGGVGPNPPLNPHLALEPPQGTAFEPHQPSVLGGVGPHPDLPGGIPLQPPPGTALTPHQRDLFTLLTREGKKKLADELIGE